MLETSKQGESGPSCQVHLLQSKRRDGFHRDGERRVHHLVGQLPHRLGQEEGPQRGHPGHTVGRAPPAAHGYDGALTLTSSTLLGLQVQPRQQVPGSGFSGKRCGLLRPFSGTIPQQDRLL